MTGGALEFPRKLLKTDKRDEFSSGAQELDVWLQRYAWENQRANNAVVYVAILEDRVVGYYAIAAAGVASSEVHEKVAAHRPTTIPCILLARLAVDKSVQGNGVGSALLRDALERSVQVGESLGAAGVLIHCRDDNARQFYLQQGDFLQSPVEALHLMISMKEIRKSMNQAKP
jgi:GNAT superfamily N-acetyltransferase